MSETAEDARVMIGRYAVCSHGRIGIITGRKKLAWGESWVGRKLDGSQWASRNPRLIDPVDAAALTAAHAEPERERLQRDGHGHVVPRIDGYRARCGGPSMCEVCRQEKIDLGRAPTPTEPSDEHPFCASPDEYDEATPTEPSEPRENSKHSGAETAPVSQNPLERIQAGAPRELLCMICDKEHPTWYAPSWLWNEVMRGGDRANADEYSFVCPTCFAVLANERIAGYTHFVLTLDGDPPRCPHGEPWKELDCDTCTSEAAPAPVQDVGALITDLRNLEFHFHDIAQAWGDKPENPMIRKRGELIGRAADLIARLTRTEPAEALDVERPPVDWSDIATGPTTTEGTEGGSDG